MPGVTRTNRVVIVVAAGIAAGAAVAGLLRWGLKAAETASWFAGIGSFLCPALIALVRGQPRDDSATGRRSGASIPPDTGGDAGVGFQPRAGGSGLTTVALLGGFGVAMIALMALTTIYLFAN